MDGWRTFLLVDLPADVDVDGDDDEVGDDVECAHAHEDVGVVEGDLFARLHHHEDDDQVGSAWQHSLSVSGLDARWGLGETYICGFMVAVLMKVTRCETLRGGGEEWELVRWPTRSSTRGQVEF